MVSPICGGAASESPSHERLVSSCDWMWPFLRCEQTTDLGPLLPTSAILISMTPSMPASLIHACVSRREGEIEEALFLFLNHPRQENVKVAYGSVHITALSWIQCTAPISFKSLSGLISGLVLPPLLCFEQSK